MNVPAERSWKERAALVLYLGLLTPLLPLGLTLAAPLLCCRQKRRRTLLPRLGLQPLPPADGDLRPLWVHALSVGELLSASTLLQELHRRIRPRPLWLSVSTWTAHQVATSNLADAWDRLFFFPYDFLPAVRSVLRRVDPALLVLVETDLWPGFLHEVRRRGLPALLVNGRLSPRTFRRFQRGRALFLPALRSFERIYPQSDGEAGRYRQLGVEPERLGRLGNLKFDVAAQPVAPDTLEALRRRLGWTGSPPVWVAGSTHPGEETLVRDVFLRLRRSQPDLRLVVVPRHPHRGGEVSALFDQAGLTTHRYSQGPPPAPVEVVVVDALGVLRALYHVATFAYVGGSLTPRGGQNPIEPAAAGVPVLFGPDMSDFPDVAADLLAAGAAVEVRDAQAMRTVLEGWLRDPAERIRRGHAARALVARHQGITQHLVEAITARLDQTAALPPRHPR